MTGQPRLQYCTSVYKLAGAGVCGNLLRWLKAYLSDRKIKVCFDDSTSEYFNIKTSIPQGSVLSPFLFNSLLSDLPNTNTVKGLSFVDDITYYVSSSDVVKARETMGKRLTLSLKVVQRMGLRTEPNKICSNLLLPSQISLLSCLIY